MSDDICGEPTGDGEPCKRTAGWGLDADKGPCKDHLKGRPTKFTDERRENILAAARAGASKDGCARAGRISRNTLDTWLEEYEDFFEAWQGARWESERRDLDDVGPEFRLERSLGYRKKDKHEHEHSGEGGGPIEFEVVIGGDGPCQD